MVNLFITKRNDGRYRAILATDSWDEFGKHAEQEGETPVMDVMLNETHRQFLHGLMLVCKSVGDTELCNFNAWLCNMWLRGLFETPMDVPREYVDRDFTSGVCEICRTLRNVNFPKTLRNVIRLQAQDWAKTTCLTC